MTNSNYVWLLAAFLVCSALFSLIKNVFMKRHAEREPTPRDEKIIDIVDNGSFSETISMGRLLCNIGSGVLGFLLLQPWFAMHSEWQNLFIVFVLVYLLLACVCVYVLTVFMPCVLGNLKPGLLSVVLLPIYKYMRLPVMIPAKIANVLFKKILKSLGYDPKLSFLSEEQREAMQSDMTKEESVLEEDGKQMILNIFDFVETPVREIMTPRVDMCAIDVDTSLEKTIEILNNERHSRLPVYKESIDNIVGVLSNRDFLEWFTNHKPEEEFNLERLVMPAIFVPYHKKIDDLLTELRRSGNQLAVVVDEYGGTAGLVTVEDILEEIVGEIRDEDDDEEDEDVQKLKDGRYILDPLVTLSDLEYELGVALDVPEGSHVETLSGLIQATLGMIPAAGTEVEIQGYKFRVLKVDGTRMEKVLMIAPKKE